MIEGAVGFLGVWGVAAVASGVSFVVGVAIVPLAKKVAELGKRFFAYITEQKDKPGLFEKLRPLGCKECMKAHTHGHTKLTPAPIYD